MSSVKPEETANTALQSPQPVADTTSTATPPKINDPAAARTEKDEKNKKRNKFFNFASKKNTGSSSGQQSQPQADPASSSPTPPANNIPHNAPNPPTTASTMTSTTTNSEQGTALHFGRHMSPPLPSSPSCRPSSSPRIISPAGSQIFERDVQENVALQPNSPAIPSHIKTEDHIPPVLDASSEAITDSHLDPDSVEIVTSSSHQPVASTAASTGVTTPHPISPTTEGNWADELAASYSRAAVASLEREDTASNYGSMDTTDVRRLSFISFADVVLSEHSGHAGPSASRESIHIAGLTSFPHHRSPSPIRSPVSSQASPPTSSPGSMKGLDLSPQRKPIGSPTPSHPTLMLGGSGTGELNIETMTQALRRTGSTDMSAVRSIPTSPIEGPSN
jgi:hypothetical protein